MRSCEILVDIIPGYSELFPVTCTVASELRDNSQNICLGGQRSLVPGPFTKYMRTRARGRVRVYFVKGLGTRLYTGSEA